jgi:hypothetical protein
MSNGYVTIARTEITNGSVEFNEVYGMYAPGDEHPIELQITYTAHEASVGNVHAAPVERKVEVFLTYPELWDLLGQIGDYRKLGESLPHVAGFESGSIPDHA